MGKRGDTIPRTALLLALKMGDVNVMWMITVI
jgi:hypothetical protein